MIRITDLFRTYARAKIRAYKARGEYTHATREAREAKRDLDNLKIRLLTVKDGQSSTDYTHEVECNVECLREMQGMLWHRLHWQPSGTVVLGALKGGLDVQWAVFALHIVRGTWRYLIEAWLKRRAHVK